MKYKKYVFVILIIFSMGMTPSFAFNLDNSDKTAKIEVKLNAPQVSGITALVGFVLMDGTSSRVPFQTEWSEVNFDDEGVMDDIYVKAFFERVGNYPFSECGWYGGNHCFENLFQMAQAHGYIAIVSGPGSGNGGYGLGLDDFSSSYVRIYSHNSWRHTTDSGATTEFSEFGDSATNDYWLAIYGFDFSLNKVQLQFQQFNDGTFGGCRSNAFGAGVWNNLNDFSDYNIDTYNTWYSAAYASLATWPAVSFC